MKILVFLFFVGLASASFHEMLDDAAHDLVLSFMEGMEKAPSLSEHLGVEHNAETMQAEDEIKTELGKKLKEGIEKILEHLKEAVKDGKELKHGMLEKLKELREKLREIKGDLGEKGKDLMREIKEQAKDYLKKLLKKYGFDKRAADDRVEEVLAELNYKDMLRKLKEHLKKTVDPELLKEKIEKLFDQGSEILQQLLKTLKEKGRRRLEMLIDVLLGDDDEDEDREARGIKDYWEKVKNYFKDLKIDLQEKYMKFGEWVKEVIDKGLENSKDKMENIKAIAREFARHAKNVSKEVGAEASEFFKQYKEDLGNIWDELKEAFKQIKERKD